jgi:Flp pilus assembly protein TadD
MAMETGELSQKQQLAALIEALKSGDYAAAISGLKDFLALHPRHEIALGLLAAAYAEIGMRNAASALYQQLLEAHPRNMLARLQLGLLMLSDDPQVAERLLARLESAR